MLFRSVASASPPAPGCCGTPTPNPGMDEEKMVEYLKELQAEKECLEALPDKGKTTNALKLIEQGKRNLFSLFLAQFNKTDSGMSCFVLTC